MFKLIIVISLLEVTAGLRFLVIGDWGSGSSAQQDVANAMQEYASANQVDFIIATGDNFYPDGVTSATDEQFTTKWRDVYTGSLSSIQWYISMGNHDHNLGGNEVYQIEFGQSEPRWYLPDYKFSFTKTAGSAQAVFISFDSQSVIQDKHDSDGIVDFVNSTLANNADPNIWKFVFGHHPAYTCARRTINVIIEDQIVTAMDQHKADVYFAGHEHNLQHLRRTGDSMNVDHIVSGGGGAGTYAFCQECCDVVAAAGVESLHFSETNGFTAIDLNDKTMVVSFRNQNNEEVNSYTRTKP